MKILCPKIRRPMPKPKVDKIWLRLKAKVIGHSLDFNRVSSYIYRSFIVCVRYWALMLQWCIQIFFPTFFGSDKNFKKICRQKSYLISTTVHLINHNNFSLIILLVVYAANIGTFSVIDWLLNFFEITFFTVNGFVRLTWNRKKHM